MRIKSLHKNQIVQSQQSLRGFSSKRQASKAKESFDTQRIVQARSIMDTRSFRSMTPRQMHQTSEKLLDAGLISHKQFRLLGAQPWLHPMHNGETQYPRDFISYWKEMQQELETITASGGTLREIETIVNLLENLESLGSATSESRKVQ